MLKAYLTFNVKCAFNTVTVTKTNFLTHSLTMEILTKQHTQMVLRMSAR